MKTELQIAKKNIEMWNFTKPQDGDLWRLNIFLNKSKTHKQTCQRWLEFLETFQNYIGVFEDELNEKIKDLKEAIKIYTEAGI